MEACQILKNLTPAHMPSLAIVHDAATRMRLNLLTVRSRMVGNSGICQTQQDGRDSS